MGTKNQMIQVRDPSPEIMKFCLYTSTTGLERFPALERFGVWRSTHKRLMQEEAGYCQDVRRFRSRVLWPTILFVIAELFLASGVVVAATRGLTAILLNNGCLVVLSVGYAVYVIVTSFRMQEFMNERVAQALL